MYRYGYSILCINLANFLNLWKVSIIGVEFFVPIFKMLFLIIKRDTVYKGFIAVLGI